MHRKQEEKKKQNQQNKQTITSWWFSAIAKCNSIERQRCASNVACVNSRWSVSVVVFVRFHMKWNFEMMNRSTTDIFNWQWQRLVVWLSWQWLMIYTLQFLVFFFLFISSCFLCLAICCGTFSLFIYFILTELRSFRRMFFNHSMWHRGRSRRRHQRHFEMISIVCSEIGKCVRAGRDWLRRRMENDICLRHK